MTDHFSNQGPRRSAGMRGSPTSPLPEHREISNVPKARADAPTPARVSASRHPQPKVLMGEVFAPPPEHKGQQIVAERQTLRAFMRANHLSPSAWAQSAGVARGELLSFLSGHSRTLSPATLHKLAAAAGTSASNLLRP